MSVCEMILMSTHEVSVCVYECVYICSKERCSSPFSFLLHPTTTTIYTYISRMCEAKVVHPR